MSIMDTIDPKWLILPSNAVGLDRDIPNQDCTLLLNDLFEDCPDGAYSSPPLHGNEAISDDTNIAHANPQDVLAPLWDDNNSFSSLPSSE